MTKGIFIQAFGKRGYGFAAVNLAMSIKFYSPNLPITIAFDEGVLKQVPEAYHKFFDVMIQIKKPDDPGRAKTSIYPYLQYDYNLFLDVDSLCLKDINPLFDELINNGGNYYCHIVGEHTIDKGRDFNAMQWAWADDIWEHYKLPQDAVLPATNSSIQFIKKCKESKALFEQINKNFSNPIPLDKLRMQWGNTQPDELYLNVALCQLKIDATANENMMFFGGHLDKRTNSELKEQFYFLSIYGGRGFTRARYTEFYDSIMHKEICRNFNMPHQFKVMYIMNDKHANNQKWKRSA
jgi:predicted transcriptional regulator